MISTIGSRHKVRIKSREGQKEMWVEIAKPIPGKGQGTFARLKKNCPYDSSWHLSFFAPLSKPLRSPSYDLVA